MNYKKKKIQTFFNFLNILLWLNISIFFINYFNLFNMIWFSESVWIILYCLTIFFAIKNDNFQNLSLSFIFLGMAGIEFCIILLVFILLKKFSISFILDKNDSNKFFQNFKLK